MLDRRFWHSLLRPAGIGKKVLAAIVLFSGAITLILSGIELYTEYEHDKKELNSYLEEIRNHQLGPIIQATWMMDEPQQESLIKSLTAIPEIAYSALYNDRGNLLFEGGMPDKYTETLKIIPLIYQSFTKSGTQPKAIHVGDLHLQGNMQTIRDHLKTRLIIILARQFFKTFLTSLFILFVVHYLINQHLYRIAYHVRHHLPKRDSGQLLALKRPKNNSANNQRDELDELVMALNQLKHDLDEQHSRVMRYQSEQVLFNQQLSGIFDAMTESVISLDQEGCILHTNQVCQSELDTPKNYRSSPRSLSDFITFYQSEDTKTPIDLKKLLLDASAHKLNLNCFAVWQNEKHPVELKIIPTQFKASDKQAFLVILRDTSEEALLREASYHASHDYLTGLSNRLTFDKTLKQVFSGTETYRSLCLIDLDYFKEINDNCGHAVGDKALITVGECMRHVMGSSNLTARLGGDEFAVLLDTTPSDAEDLCKHLLDSMKLSGRRIPELNSHKLTLSASIGITRINVEDDDPESVYERADKACYQVKKSGRSGVGTLLHKGMLAEAT